MVSSHLPSDLFNGWLKRRVCWSWGPNPRPVHLSNFFRGNNTGPGQARRASAGYSGRSCYAYLMSKALIEVFPSAARTSAPADKAVDLSSGTTALSLLIDVTALTATPTITVTVKGLVPGSGSEYTILESSGISAVGVTQLEIGPGLVEEANHSVSALLPQELTVSVAHSDTDSITYSIWGILI